MEKLRLEDLHKQISTVDASQDIVDQFPEEVWNLFDEVATWIGLPQEQAEAQLLSAFNNDSAAFVIYYFQACACILLYRSIHQANDAYNTQLLVTDFMLKCPNSFAPFLDEDTTLEKYVESMRTPDKEIEELGVKALAEVLFQPAGFGLRVLNLHTNDGPEVDTYEYSTPSTTVIGGCYTPHNPAVTCLLFRP